MEPSIAWIGLGSNLGDRKGWIEKALLALEKPGEIDLLSVSPLMETRPQGGPLQPNFLNGVAKISTTLSPNQLLSHLLNVESQLQRKRVVSNGPRTVDLDLLFYHQEIIQTPDLTLPHPEICHRYFVLKPLFDMAPQWVHPLEKKTIAELWMEFLTRSKKGDEGWEV